MSDPPKSSAPFSFTQSSTSGSSGGLFGQGTSNTQKPASSLFGSGSNQPTSSSESGGITGGNSATSIFAGAAKPSSGWSFGQAQNNSPAGGLFSPAQPGAQNSQPPVTTAPSTGLFSTPNKPSEQPATSQSQTSNLFGGAASTGSGFSFGNLASNSSTAGQTATTTPTSKPTSNLFGNSTTPAGPPPSNTTGANSGSVLFGKPPAPTSSNPFASFGQSSSAQQPTPSTTTKPGALGGFSLGAITAQGSSATSSGAQSTSIFSSTPNAANSNPFGNKRGSESNGGLFSNLGKTQDTGATKSDVSQPSQSAAPQPSNIFSTGPQIAATSTAPKTNTSLFGDANAKPALNFGKATQGTVASPAATQSGFNFFDKVTSSGTSAPSASAPSSNLGDLFPSFGKPNDKATTTTIDSGVLPAPASTTAPATSNLFGNPDKAANSANSQAPAQATANQGLGGLNTNLGASTAGPAPTAQSRLKNKSMDDIITRWASDLSKYQKEFQQQAEKVATWDRMLVENSNKIQKLYGSTLEAERATTEVERQLSAVENDQEELSLWLDHYEKEVDVMISSSVGQGENLSGPDQERERT